MRITIKLFASLAAYLPLDARDRHRVDIEVEPGTTVLDAIRAQRIPESLCAIVLVDGQWVGRPARASRELREGEILAVWPPVAGGAPPFTRSLEMSGTREEFLRLLPAAVARFDVRLEEVCWMDQGRRGVIRLTAMPDRPVARGSSPATLHIPRHRVEISLEGYSAVEGEAFMARFHRAFLRGGG